MIWRERESYERREYSKGHHTRLCERDELAPTFKCAREADGSADVGDVRSLACKRHGRSLSQVLRRLLSMRSLICMLGIMLSLRLFMIHSEPAITRNTMKMPNA